MTEQTVTKSPQVVAKALDISPASLRRWSDEFTDFLSTGAGSGKNRSHRRYSESDVETLIEIKELMNNGMTYEQVRQELGSAQTASVMSDDIDHLGDTAADVSPANGVLTSDEVVVQPGVSESSPVEPEQVDSAPTFQSDVAAEPNVVQNVADYPGDPDTLDGGTMALVSPDSESPAVAFLTNTLSSLSDTQKSILNSQSANRELLGVLLQDNFNLKEENNRLRERILDVERQMSQHRQEEEWRLEALRKEFDAKISSASQLATEAIVTARSVEAPEIKAVETKPGCMGLLFGRGGTQIITTKPRQASVATGAAAPSHPVPSMGVDQGGMAPAHPKPMLPPE